MGLDLAGNPRFIGVDVDLGAYEYQVDPDSDGDGLLDGEEANKYKTDYNKADTDGDGLNDRVEIIIGSDPLDQLSQLPSGGTPIILVNGEVVIGKTLRCGRPGPRLKSSRLLKGA